MYPNNIQKAKRWSRLKKTVSNGTPTWLQKATTETI